MSDKCPKCAEEYRRAKREIEHMYLSNELVPIELLRTVENDLRKARERIAELEAAAQPHAETENATCECCKGKTKIDRLLFHMPQLIKLAMIDLATYIDQLQDERDKTAEKKKTEEAKP